MWLANTINHNYLRLSTGALKEKREETNLCFNFHLHYKDPMKLLPIGSSELGGEKTVSRLQVTNFWESRYLCTCVHGKKGSRHLDSKVFTLVGISLGEDGKRRVPHLTQGDHTVWKNTTIWNYYSFFQESCHKSLSKSRYLKSIKQLYIKNVYLKI